MTVTTGGRVIEELPEGAVRVLDLGFVRLDGAMADDLSVVNSARVSFGQRESEMTDRNKGLVGFLMRERHGSPFEHNAFRFHVRAPLTVVREWQRHRIASYNEESGRYSQLERAFYIPENIRTQVGKPGAYRFEPVDEHTKVVSQVRIRTLCDAAFDAYEEMIADGVAKEVARGVLPLNTYSQFYFTTNARALMNFLSLRNSEHAMFEIREYARVLEGFFQAYMPVTHAAFIENGRTAP